MLRLRGSGCAPSAPERGLSIMEVMVVSFLILVLLGTAASNLTVLERPLENAKAEAAGFIKLVRARGMASTLAYTISVQGTDRLVAEYATECGEPATSDSALTLTLPRHVQITTPTWSVCFTPRGLAQSNPTLDLRDNEGKTATLEVFLGGAVRVS